MTMRSMFVFFLMIRRPPRSTLDRSSAASDVYKRQPYIKNGYTMVPLRFVAEAFGAKVGWDDGTKTVDTVSYTHLRAHETVLDLVCRLLLEKKKKSQEDNRVTRRPYRSQHHARSEQHSLAANYA